MQPTRDAAAVRLPPPLVFAAAIAAGGLLERYVFRLRLPLDGPARIVVVVLTLALGLLLAGFALGLFRKTGQKPEPWTPTPELVSDGIYRYTRNPMYVGMALVQISVAIGYRSGWILAFVPLSLAVVWWTAVRHEEAYLERKFGDAYRDYKRAVRRWL